MDRASTETDRLLGFSFRRIAGRPGAGTLVALHGSGADETQVIPFASSLAPAAGVIAPRGRIDQNGERRWFRKITTTSFDGRSIRAQTKAFAAFIDALRVCGELDADTVFIGYSNGGNLLHSTMLLHPDRVRTAILLRCMPVLARPPMTDLGAVRVLVLAGAHDRMYGPFSPDLARLMEERGASVDMVTVAAAHEIGELDVSAAKAWLAGLRPA